MSDLDEEVSPPEALPETLVEQLDALDRPELEAVQSHVEKLIDARRTPLETEIEADAAGEILEIESHGAYALVRMHPPTADGSGVNTDITSLYHVQRERHVDGTESLHWDPLGNVHNPEHRRCETCGRPLDGDVDVCPHCGDDERSEE